MDGVKNGESYFQQNTSDDVVNAVNGVDYIYSLKGSEADNVVSKNPQEVVTSSEGPDQEEKTSKVSKRSACWTADETYVLLEAWGERLLRNSRRRVQSAKWDEVVEKVSEVSECTRTKKNCRHRLDTLTRLYKKEKIKFAKKADYTSPWAFFSKMDFIVSSSSLKQRRGIQIVNNEVHPSHRNSSDEMRNELVGDEDIERPESRNMQNIQTSRRRKMVKEDNLEDIQLKKRKLHKENSISNPYKVIATSLNKFADIYERVEKNRMKKMVELQKMRMNFQKEMELERTKNLLMWEVEMAKILSNYRCG